MTIADALKRMGFHLYLGLVFAFLLAPLAYIVIGSFNESTLVFPPRSLSLASYREIPGPFFHALYISLIVAAGSTCIAVPVGVCGAIGVLRGRFPFRDAIGAALLSPLLLPMLVLGIGLYQFYVALDRTIGTSLAGSLIGLILGHTSFCIPYVMRAVTPVVAQLPAHIEEAAYDLGATRWETFTKVTLPLIRMGVIGGAAFAFLTSFDNFPMSLFLAEGDRTTLPVAMFQYIEFDLKPTILAMSSLVILISMGAMLLIERTIGLASFVGLRRS